jgi:hypothetical protein
MAKRRRSRTSKQPKPHSSQPSQPSRVARGSQPNLPKAAETVGFTDAEQAFFRTGDDSGALALAVEHEEYEPEQPRSSFWRRLFLLSS